jgi:hypothetical protein
MAPFRTAALAALAVLLLSTAPAARAAEAAAAAAAPEAAAAADAASSASAERAISAESFARQARAVAAKAARTLARGPQADADGVMSAGRTAGEALAHEAAREAQAAKAARGPLHPGGARSANEAYARSGVSEAAAVACAQEWGQCGREQERGELLTVSCELGDEDAFCFEGYLADGLKAAGDAGDDVAIFRCRRDDSMSTAASACAAPSASWTRTSTGGIGHAVSATFSSSSRASTDAVETLKAANAIAAQAERLREGVLEAARMGELSVPTAGFGAGFQALLGDDSLEGELLPGTMGGSVFDFA